MQGLLRGTLLSIALASSTERAIAQPSGDSAHDTTQIDTAGLRQGLQAAFGGEVEIVRTELRGDLHERSGTFWLAHVRPLRSGDYHLRYEHHYRDRVRPDDPLYTHVEHTTGFSVGVAGCGRRAEGRTACLGDVIVVPVEAGDDEGRPLGGHVFEARRVGDGMAVRPTVPPAPADDGVAATPNPAAPHLRYLGTRLEEMPHRSIGESVEVSAAFEAVASGALELVVGRTTVPVLIVERGTPVTVLLENERIRQYHHQAGFASHLGSQYSTDLLILQPGDRIDVSFREESVRGRHFTEEEKEAFRGHPAIAVRPFRLDRERRFNAFIADHLPSDR